ncbi:MAG TPA: nitroreductase family protein [Candidatus Lokiarchaeia archaeon]|nr:nitroreductase family protein [Candidatus Lokiarchaeia archaeon]
MLQIDLSKCTRCQSCARNCSVLEMEESGPVEKYPENCNECGHCVAICPVGAIAHENMDMNDFQDVADPGISFEQFVQLARNRRSMRRFTKEPVSREDIDKILETVRYIPTAENAQELEYLVITDPARMTMIRGAIVKYFKMLRNLVSRLYFIVKIQMGKRSAKRARSGLNLLLQRHETRNDPAEDLFMYGAPALLIIHAPKKVARGATSFAVTDAGIASYYVMLACESLGIGTCWCGFHVRFANMFKSFHDISLVPKGHDILASILMGHPASKYKRNVYRRPVKAEIIDH